MRKALQSDNLISLLHAVITSGKYWRCIRWCNQGTTIIITSPKLFEKEVLRGDMKELSLKDFSSFADVLLRAGFQRVPNPRPSKVYKFCHPRLQKNSNGICAFAKDAGRIEQNGLQRQRKRKMACDNDNSGINDKNSNLTGPLVKKHRKLTPTVSKDTFFEDTVGTRKVENDKVFIRGKRKSLFNPGTSSTSANQTLADKQVVHRVYSPLEMIAAHALLSLASTPVVQFGHNHVSQIELMAAKSLYDLSRSSVFFGKRSVRELVAAEALLELSCSC